MTIQAIVTRRNSIAATFTGAPTPEERKTLRAAGAEFKNGQWVRSEAESIIIDGAEAVKVIAETAKAAA